MDDNLPPTKQPQVGQRLPTHHFHVTIIMQESHRPTAQIYLIDVKNVDPKNKNVEKRVFMKKIKNVKKS